MESNKNNFIEKNKSSYDSIKLETKKILFAEENGRADINTINVILENSKTKKNKVLSVFNYIKSSEVFDYIKKKCFSEQDSSKLNGFWEDVFKNIEYLFDQDTGDTVFDDDALVVFIKDIIVNAGKQNKLECESFSVLNEAIDVILGYSISKDKKKFLENEEKKLSDNSRVQTNALDIKQQYLELMRKLAESKIDGVPAMKYFGNVGASLEQPIKYSEVKEKIFNKLIKHSVFLKFIASNLTLIADYNNAVKKQMKEIKQKLFIEKEKGVFIAANDADVKKLADGINNVFLEPLENNENTSPELFVFTTMIREVMETIKNPDYTIDLEKVGKSFKEKALKQKLLSKENAGFVQNITKSVSLTLGNLGNLFGFKKSK